MKANIRNAATILGELRDDRDLARKIATAMEKQGHRWHDTPPGRTPNVSEVLSTMGYICDRMAGALADNPNVDRQRVGTGGISVYYWQWPGGGEEIELRYSPEGVFRSWNPEREP